METTRDNQHITHDEGRQLEGPKPLPPEKLDAYRVAIELCELVSELRPKRGCAQPHDQLRRAAASIVLNIAEGCGRAGRDRRHFFRIARGSALESAAALRVLRAFRSVSRYDHDAGRELCARLYAMLTRMSGSGRR